MAISCLNNCQAFHDGRRAAAKQKVLLATYPHPPPPSALPLLTWTSKIKLLSNRMTDSSLYCVLLQANSVPQAP